MVLGGRAGHGRPADIDILDGGLEIGDIDRLREEVERPAIHGGADVGSGATGMVAGAIGSAAATSKAAQLTSLSENNQNLKQQNYWNAIQGLNSVGAQYGGSGATAIGGANSAAEGAVNAGSGATAAGNAGWQDLGSLLGGIGALVTGGAGIAKDFNSPSSSNGGGNSGGF